VLDFKIEAALSNIYFMDKVLVVNGTNLEKSIVNYRNGQNPPSSTLTTTFIKVKLYAKDSTSSNCPDNTKINGYITSWTDTSLIISNLDLSICQTGNLYGDFHF